MATALTQAGWALVPPGAAPDLALVNTCTVTARADQQARQAVRRLARRHPGAAIWVTGCYAQRAPAEVAALPGVALVFGNQEKADLPTLMALSGHGQGPRLRVRRFSSGQPFQVLPVTSFPGHTRAWLKVQDGCQHACGYCIVPSVRGPRRSLPPPQVLASLEALAAGGYQEVVLTGIDLGQYGRDLDPPATLADLLRSLASRPWPLRLRLSSLEPHEVTADLVEALAAFPDLCPHFHLPLQSGSPAVLQAMNRPYQAAHGRDLVHTLHRRFPAAALGLDILVGFPGEAAADFDLTRQLVEDLPVAYLHVFPYSPRPGTPASALAPLLPREVRRRAHFMRALGRRKQTAFRLAQVGTLTEVLVEGPAAGRPGWLRALSANYLRVLLPGPPDWHNRRLLVRLREVQGDVLLAAGLP